MTQTDEVYHLAPEPCAGFTDMPEYTGDVTGGHDPYVEAIKRLNPARVSIRLQ